MEIRHGKKSMIDPVVDALVLDLLEWLGSGERTYQEAIDIWRTSCPRLPVWEDAKDRGLVAKEHMNGREVVRMTPAGRAYLQQRRTPQKSETSGIPPTR
jgi:hypothetical protein